MPDFTVTPDEQKLIDQIADAILQISVEHDVPYTKMEIVMDLTSCHCNGTPLRLQDFLNAATKRQADFVHDAFGIRRYISRTTGKLSAPFQPRFAK
jgi:hypothetical protein